jgi:hypothetical protein
MGQTKPITITMLAFRRMDTFSGEMRVVSGSRTRRGVRRHGRRASCKSPEELAGTDAACGAAAGESAHTSAAHAASCTTDAELAKSKAEDAERTPKKKSEKGNEEKSQDKSGSTKKGGGGDDGPGIESLWEERAQLDGGDPLPEDAVGFVDAVNDHIDMVRTTELLLRGRDEKSSKSLLELLLEMKYGKEARALRAQVMV